MLAKAEWYHKSKEQALQELIAIYRKQVTMATTQEQQEFFQRLLEIASAESKNDPFRVEAGGAL